MTYDYRTIVDDAESISRRKLQGMPREDILAYEVGILRGVVQTLCKILDVQEKTIDTQTQTIENYKRITND
jgi:hypothetical protein